MGQAGLPPGLSMLWERADSADALTARFGFLDLAAASRWVTEVLGIVWGVSAGPVVRLVISDSNAVAWVGSDRGDLVVKWSHDAGRFAALAASTEVLRRVGEHGAPVVAPLAGRDGRVRAVVDGPAGPLSVAVLAEVAGRWLDVDDPDAVRAAGVAMAAVHDALSTIEPEAVPDAAVMGPVADRVRLWLAHGDRGFAPEASRRLAAMVAAAPDLTTEPQVVHNDVRAANLLMDGATVAAVLDFDDVVVDQPVSDLAKACTYLETRFTGWGPTAPAVQRRFVDGYGSVRPLSTGEETWLDIGRLWLGIAAIPAANDPAGWGRWL